MKYIFKWMTVLSLTLTSLWTVAGDIPATTIMDDYVGAGYYGNDVYGSKSQFDIDQMEVNRTGTTMTVNIYSAFANYTNRNGSAFKNGYGLGDLFMSADANDPNANPWNPANDDRYSDSNGNNTGTDWNYAYSIYNQNRNQTSGWGHLVSGFDNDDLTTSTNNHGNNARYDQGVSLNSYDNVEDDWSRWDTEKNSYYKDGVMYGKISFEFDVAGTALATANQIAFRWAMSCANDIIEGLVSITDTPPVSVPEPETLLLMLLGLAGIISRRKTFVQRPQLTL